MDKKRIRVVAEEATRLLFENPEWTHKQAINKAREVLGYEKAETMEETN